MSYSATSRPLYRSSASPPYRSLVSRSIPTFTPFIIPFLRVPPPFALRLPLFRFEFTLTRTGSIPLDWLFFRFNQRQIPTGLLRGSMDLRSHDLCEALTQLAIKDFVVVEGSGADSWAPGGVKGDIFVEEAKEFMLALPQRFGSTANIAPLTGLGVVIGLGTTTGETSMCPVSMDPKECQTPLNIPSSLSPSPLASASFHREAPPLSEVLNFLPTHQEALSAYTYFTGYVSWFVLPFLRVFIKSHQC